jgi:hypothetical protein
LYRVLNGVKTYATQNDDYFGFDIQLWLDGIQQTSNYIPGTLIGIDKFTSSCKFVLVNPDEGNIVWDTKEVTKEYAEKGEKGEKGEDGDSGKPGSNSPVIYSAGE